MADDLREDNNETPTEENLVLQRKGVLKHQYESMTLEDLKLLLIKDEISKHQKKKIIKQINWLENVEERRQQRRDKRRAKALKRKQDVFSEVHSISKTKRPRKEKISTDEDFDKHVHIAVDLSFNDCMTNLDMSKLRKQIAWCYKENRRSTAPVQYHICGLAGRLQDGMDETYKNWDVHFDNELYKRFEKKDLVYLTSDSANVITTINPGKVYVIGGLVDHNKQKGLTYKMAQERGVDTGRLPLDEHLDMKTRKVLTVNHVFHCILAYNELRDWKSAFLKVIPPRKGAIALEHDTNDGDNKPEDGIDDKTKEHIRKN